MAIFHSNSGFPSPDLLSGSLKKASRLSKFAAAISGIFLANLDFSSLVSSWTTGRTGFSSAYATDEWLLQETSGTYANNVGTATFTNTGGLQGQTAVGVWNGSSYINYKAWEALDDGDYLTCSSADAGDASLANDFCVRLVFRMKDPAYVGTGDYLIQKLVATNGWRLLTTTDGQFYFSILGSGAFGDYINLASGAPTGSFYDGALHYLTMFYDSSANILYGKTDLSSEVSGSTATISTDFSNAGVISINGNGSSGMPGGMQVVYPGLSVGANAEAMYNEDFWKQGTAEGITLLRNSVVGHVVGEGSTGDYVASFSNNSVPIVYNSELSSTNKLGILVTNQRKNYIKYSENLDDASWLKGGGIGVTVNGLDAPSGFRNACILTKELGASFSNLYALTDEDLVAGQVYTLSFWFYHIEGGVVRCSIRNEADTTFWGIRKFVTFESNKWTRVAIPFVPSANEKALIRLRPGEGGVDQVASVGFWGVEVKDNDAISAFEAGEYIPTSGAAQTVAATVINVPSAKISSSIGDLTVKYLLYRSQESYILYPENTGSATDFVNLRNTTASGTTVSIDWDGSVSEEDYKHPDFIGIGEETTTRLVYNYQDGVSGKESVTYVNGVRRDGSDFPFEGTIEDKESTDLYLGSNGTNTNMTGLISNVNVRQSNLSLPADVTGDVIGTDIWTTKQEIDFSVHDLGDLGLWTVQDFTVGWTRDPANAAKNGNVYELTCPSGLNLGGEIGTSSGSYLQGSYRCVMKTAPVYGAVSAFFFYSSDTDEIDIEILSRENSQGIAHVVVHENVGDTHKYIPLGFDPSADFHEYRIDFKEEAAEFWIDGMKRTEITESIPATGGNIIVNCWNSDDVSWADGPPAEPTVLQIRSITLYTDLPSFVSGYSANTTTTSLVLNKPNFTQEGDVLVAFVGCDSEAGDFTSAPTGWSLLDSEVIEVDGDGTGPQVDNLRLRSYIKVAGDSEPASYTWGRNTDNSAIGWIGTYKGNATQPDANAGQAITASGTVCTQDSINTVVKNSDIVYAWLIRRVDDSDYLPLSEPNGMTERLNTTASPSNWGMGLCVYDQRIVEPGAVGTKTLSPQVSVGALGVRVVIKP